MMTKIYGGCGSKKVEKKASLNILYVYICIFFLIIWILKIKTNFLIFEPFKFVCIFIYIYLYTYIY